MSNVKRIERIVKRDGKVHTVKSQATVATAAKEMRKYHVGCLIVVDKSGGVVGIVTERDIIDKVVAKTSDPLSICVSAIMTPKVISCSMQTEIPKARKLMARHGTRHLPIIEGTAAVGMISSRDIMAHELSATRAIVRKQSQVLTELEQSHPGITKLQKDSGGRIVI